MAQWKPEPADESALPPLITDLHLSLDDLWYL